IFWEQDGVPHVEVTGPETGTATAPVPAGATFVGVQMAVGTALRMVPTGRLLDGGISLPEVTRRGFRARRLALGDAGRRRRRGTGRAAGARRRRGPRPRGRRRAARRPPRAVLTERGAPLPRGDRLLPGSRAADRPGARGRGGAHAGRGDRRRRVAARLLRRAAPRPRAAPLRRPDGRGAARGRGRSERARPSGHDVVNELDDA